MSDMRRPCFYLPQRRQVAALQERRTECQEVWRIFCWSNRPLFSGAVSTTHTGVLPRADTALLKWRSHSALLWRWFFDALRVSLFQREERRTKRCHTVTLQIKAPSLQKAGCDSTPLITRSALQILCDLYCVSYHAWARSKSSQQKYGHMMPVAAVSLITCPLTHRLSATMGYNAALGAKKSGANGAYWLVRNSWACRMSRHLSCMFYHTSLIPAHVHCRCWRIRPHQNGY